MSKARVMGSGAFGVSAVVTAVDVAHPFFNDVGGLALIGVALVVVVRERVARGLCVLATVLWVASAYAPRGFAPAKVVVYGVDGATFDVIDAQNLPNFEALEREGTRAVLTSMEPMFSPLLWTTIGSGRTPADHGVRGFHVQTTDCLSARFFDIAEAEGRSIGVYKWLVDYPPRRDVAFWVPSWLAPGPETWPSNLTYVKELELSRRMRRKQVATVHSTPALVAGLVRAGVRLSTLVRAAAWSVEERVLHRNSPRAAPDPAGAVRANVAMQLLRGRVDRDVFIAQLYVREPELATFNYYATDGLAHLYWDRPDAIAAAYTQADQILGDIRGALGPEARLIVVSDHGFKAMDGTGLAGQFAPLTERLRARFEAQVGKADVAKVGHKLLIGLANPTDAPRAMAWLATLTDAAGAPFYTLEDLGGGTIGLTLADEQITRARLATDTVGAEPITDYVKLTDAYTGTHEARGIFYAAGPGADAGVRLAPQSLLDVAPTVLAALGIAASIEMPGSAATFLEVAPRVADWDHVLVEANRRVLGGAAGQDEEALRALGYIE